MLGRGGPGRYVRRVDGILGELARQLEFIGDQRQWRDPARRRLGKLTPPDALRADHDALLELVGRAVPFGELDEAEVREWLERRDEFEADAARLLAASAGEAYGAALAEALDDLRADRRRFYDRVLDEYERAAARLRRLRPPEGLGEQHAALVEGVTAARADAAVLYERLEDAPAEAALGAWRAADASSGAFFAVASALFELAGA